MGDSLREDDSRSKHYNGCPSLLRSLRQGGDFDSSVKSYNSRMCRIPSLVLIGLAVLTSSTFAQQSQPAKPTVNVPIALPKASLWNRYSFQFQATGDHGPIVGALSTAWSPEA